MQEIRRGGINKDRVVVRRSFWEMKHSCFFEEEVLARVTQGSIQVFHDQTIISFVSLGETGPIKVQVQ